MSRLRTSHFAAGLLRRCELDKVLAGLKTCFFCELPLRRREWIFIRPVFSLWDRPRAKILLVPEGSAGMNEKDFKRLMASSVHEQAGACFPHVSILSTRADDLSAFLQRVRYNGPRSHG